MITENYCSFSHQSDSISVWWFIGDVLQMNRHSGTVGSWFLLIGFILYGTKPWKNTTENVELSEFVFSLHVLIIFILYASMWLHYMFSLFCQKEPTERTRFGELFGRWRGTQLIYLVRHHRHGSYNLEKVLNFSSHLEKSLNSLEVLEKYLISLLGL